MPPVHTLHTRERHSGGGRPGAVAIISRADVATPERSSSQIKKNRIYYIVKEMF